MKTEMTVEFKLHPDFKTLIQDLLTQVSRVEATVARMLDAAPGSLTKSSVDKAAPTTPLASAKPATPEAQPTLVGSNADSPAVAQDTGSDDDFAPKPKRGRPKKSVSAFDDEESSAKEPDADGGKESEDEANDANEDFMAPPKAKASQLKSARYTVDDVNDACKKRASLLGGKAGRTAVLDILKSEFGTESISQLKPEQYAECIEAMNSAFPPLK